MQIGRVKWFNPTAGYGFIQPDNGANDIFVHISAVEYRQDLQQNERVRFDVAPSQRQNGSLEARDVKVID
jgi:CspA family cold shock protein